MSAAFAFADEGANEYAELCDRWDAVRRDGITLDELAEVDAIHAGFRQLQPTIEEGAVTLRSIAQLARSGVLRYPLAHTRREIADLAAYKRQRQGVKNVSSINRAKNRRVTDGSPDAA